MMVQLECTLLQRGGGWDVRDGHIVPALTATPEVAEMESLLLEKLSSFGWQVATRHLKSAQRSYEDSNWTACNSQLRTFLQEVCDQIAATRYPKESATKNAGGERRKLLSSKGFLSKEESGYLEHLFKLLHTAGAHPGISDERTARMRRFVTETTALYLIEKLEGST